MTARYDQGKYDFVEYLKKKDSKEWSSSSGSKRSASILFRLGKLKTLPQTPWHEMDQVMADLKATLPDISPKEVRRFYMPLHEAILLELEEERYEEAGRYMKQLLEIDEKVNEQSFGTTTGKKTYLKDQKDFILRLKNGLVTFENARKKGDYVTRAMSLLDNALFFESRIWKWWWVAERLYQSALSAAEYIEDDDLYTITLIRYLYGRFLFHKMQKSKEVLEYLNDARDASEQKKWNASKKLGEKQSTIFVECNTLLYKVLLILAQQERPQDPDFALKACIEALERAMDAGHNEYVVEALHELGKSYVIVRDIKHALRSFSKMLAIARRIPDGVAVCNAHMELAFAYKQLDDNVHTEKHLRMLRENADEFGLTEKLADAHYYTGEHHLSQGNLDLSTAHLENALCLYNRLRLSDEADRARSIAGISKGDWLYQAVPRHPTGDREANGTVNLDIKMNQIGGQERIEEYFSVILRCGQFDEDATLKLCKWKSRRERFWEDKIYDDKSDMEVPYENSVPSSSSSQSFLNG